jgi:hypothetical protein
MSLILIVVVLVLLFGGAAFTVTGKDTMEAAALEAS